MNDVGVDSPFAPPSTDDRGLQVDRPATWFQLEDTVVVCGRELRLPAYCLVSGESVSLSEPLQLKVVAGTAWSASLLAAILLGVIAMAFGGWLSSAESGCHKSLDWRQPVCHWWCLSGGQSGVDSASDICAGDGGTDTRQVFLEELSGTVACDHFAVHPGNAV